MSPVHNVNVYEIHRPTPPAHVQEAAVLFDEALHAARISAKEVAHLCGVSTCLVHRWRSPDDRNTPSFAQLLLLPVAFHWELHKAISRRFYFQARARVELEAALGQAVIESAAGGRR